GFFFDPPYQNQDSEELLTDSAFLGSQDDLVFRHINTTWMIIVELLLTTCLGIVTFLVPFLCGADKCGISAFSVIVYTHGTWWFVVLLADRYLRWQHNLSRTYGYLEFYRQTKNIRRWPVMVFSAGNALLLIVLTLLHDYCSEDTDHCPGFLAPLHTCNYLQFVITLEVVVVTPILIIYLVKTVKFNKRQPSPDVTQEDTMSAFLHSQAHTSDVGFRDETFLDDVLEKQADLIRYLKQHNAHLGRKILQLTTQLNEARSSPPPQQQAS
ncbi:transmembrane protein 192, partial [Lamellibrachia satsuma]